MIPQPVFAEDEVQRRFKGRTRLFMKFSNRFCDRLPELKAELDGFREAEDAEAIRTWAHALAGVVGNLGGKRLFDAAKALEFAAEEPDKPATIVSRLDALERELLVFETELRVQMDKHVEA